MSLSAPTTLTSTGHSTGAPPALRPRASLTVAMLGFAVVTLDTQVVNVALPDINRNLGGTLSGLQWVVTGYTLMFSALLLFAGTFSDRIGARRAYGVGMMIFVVASAVCGFAPGMGWLVAARIVQGIGAALVTPTSLALIRAAYHEPAARARAIAYWAMGGSMAAAAGPVLGGALTQLDWRLIFFLNLPVGVVAVLVLRGAADSPRRVVPFDWTGQITAVLALGALTSSTTRPTSTASLTPTRPCSSAVPPSRSCASAPDAEPPQGDPASTPYSRNSLEGADRGSLVSGRVRPSRNGMAAGERGMLWHPNRRRRPGRATSWPPSAAPRSCNSRRCAATALCVPM
jgi:hypothetical protein